MVCNKMRIVLIGISILLSLQCCLAVGQVRSNNDGKELETVQKYIQKLGLDARWGEYLENELATERKAQRRKEIADLLAYEYGEMLFRLEETGAIVKKSENLLQIYHKVGDNPRRDAIGAMRTMLTGNLLV